MEGARWLSALRRYLAVGVSGHLLWEFGHMPLYTLATAGTTREIVAAALHRTGGDALIALKSIAVALAGDGRWPARRFAPVAVLTLLTGLGYTVFSEWLDVDIRAAWAYSPLMPVAAIGSLGIGLSPLLQWLVVPALALTAAARALTSGWGPAVPRPGSGPRPPCRRRVRAALASRTSRTP